VRDPSVAANAPQGDIAGDFKQARVGKRDNNAKANQIYGWENFFLSNFIQIGATVFVRF
jgi:hypothetical protein